MELLNGNCRILGDRESKESTDQLSTLNVKRLIITVSKKQPMKNLPRGPEQGFGRCLQSQERCRCQTAAAWSGNVSACSAGEPHRWLAAAGSPATRKRKRTVRCCNAVAEMALHSGSVGNDDSRWSLGRND